MPIETATPLIRRTPTMAIAKLSGVGISIARERDLPISLGPAEGRGQKLTAPPTYRRKRRMIMAAVVMSLIAGCGRSANADLAVTFSSPGQSSSASGADYTVGFSFTTTAAVTVATLDYLDGDLPSTGGVVRLYDGLGNVLATATVQSSDPTESTGGLQYRVHDLLSPVPLAANTTYYIAGDFLGGDFFPARLQGLSTVPGIQYGHAVVAFTPGQTPTTSNGFGTSVLPVDFDLTPVAAVPEPSTAILAAFGAVAILAYGWSRHRRDRRRQGAA